MMKNKQGELSTSMLIGMILLVVGIVIMSTVYYQIAWNPTIDRESCHASVVLRATVPDLAKSYVPLKCATKKTCLSSGLFGGKCDDEKEDFEGIKGISKQKVSDINAVEKAIAGEVIDCWTMMGEGKVSLFSEGIAEKFGFKNEIYPTCVICSRISADESLTKELTIEKLSKANPYEYMRTHKVPTENISYLDFINGGVKGQGVSFGGEGATSSFDFSLITSESERTKLKTELESYEYVDDEKFEELAVVFMQISATNFEDMADNWAKGVGTVGIASVWAAPLKSAGCLINPYCMGSILAVGGIGFAYASYNNWNNQAISASYCGDISYGKDARKGCSVIRVTKYDAEDLKKFCGVIESLP